MGSRSEFDRLVRRSYVIGVMDVGVSELAIDRQLAMEGLADKDYSREESLAALRAAFEADSRLVATKLHPEMGEDGVMTLKGTVRSLEESDAAEFTARSIPGVLRVSNRLKIQPGAAKLADATDPPRVLPRGPR